MRPIISVVLAILIASAPRANAGGAATLSGNVRSFIDVGAVVNAVWAGRASAPVAADGSFLFETLSPGPTQLTVETSEGLYVVAAPLVLAPGTTRRVQLAFGGRKDTSAAPQKTGKTKAPHGWANPVTATLVVVGSAIVVGVAVDQLTKSSQAAASPSVPSN